METGPVRIKTLISAVAAVLAIELLAAWQGFSGDRSLFSLGLARCLEIGFFFMIAVRFQPEGPPALGLVRSQILTGLFKGLRWSLCFGILVTLAAVVLALAGQNPFDLVGTNLPRNGPALLAFFLVGGLVSPVAEEMFFRGILFGYLRRWGVWTAIGGSTLLFVLAHAPGRGVPLPQLVGGVLFAGAYEKEKNLLVPITIHVLGNLAIFTVSLI